MIFRQGQVRNAGDGMLYRLTPIGLEMAACFGWHFFGSHPIISTVRLRIFSLLKRRRLFAGLAVWLLLRAGGVMVAATADYLVDVWDTENNLPGSTVTAIAQTPDGYLWVGTYNGLARFDGVRFVTFDPGQHAGVEPDAHPGAFPGCQRHAVDQHVSRRADFLSRRRVSQ